MQSLKLYKEQSYILHIMHFYAWRSHITNKLPCCHERDGCALWLLFIVGVVFVMVTQYEFLPQWPPAGSRLLCNPMWLPGAPNWTQSPATACLRHFSFLFRPKTCQQSSILIRFYVLYKDHHYHTISFSSLKEQRAVGCFISLLLLVYVQISFI